MIRFATNSYIWKITFQRLLGFLHFLKTNAKKYKGLKSVIYILITLTLRGNASHLVECCNNSFFSLDFPSNTASTVANVAAAVQHQREHLKTMIIPLLKYSSALSNEWMETAMTKIQHHREKIASQRWRFVKKIMYKVCVSRRLGTSTKALPN